MKKSALVCFEPSAIRGQVSVGLTVLEAAHQLGVPLRSVCGGKASCTTCRVRVQRGEAFLSEVNEKEERRLPEFRLQEGWRLGCQARLKGPAVLEVPSVMEWIRIRSEEEDRALE